MWHQLASFAPPAASVVAVSPEVCGAPSATAQLSAAGFRVVNALVLGERALSGELQGSSHTCCLAAEGSAGAAAAAAHEEEPGAADVLVLADLLLMTDARRALQVGGGRAGGQERHASRSWCVLCAQRCNLSPPGKRLQAARRHLRESGLLAVLFTERDLSSPFALELEELLEGAVPGERSWWWFGAAGWVSAG